MGPPLREPGLRLESGAVGDAVQPAAQRGGPPDRPGFARQGEESDLEGVLGVGLIAQHGPADVEHHRPVAAQQRLERGFVPAGSELPQQFLVGSLFEPLVFNQAENLPQRGAGRGPGHGWLLGTGRLTKE